MFTFFIKIVMIEPKISLNTNYLYLQKLILSSLILDLLWSSPWLPRWHPLWLQHPLRLLWPEAKIFVNIYFEARIFLRQRWWFGENCQYALAIQYWIQWQQAN